jgi:hypothetical protein
VASATPISAITPKIQRQLAKQHGLTHAGRDHGHDHKDHRDRRLHARHPVAFVQVTDDRGGTQTCAGKAHQRAQHQQLGEILNQPAGRRTDDIGRDAGQQHRASPETVRQSPGTRQPSPLKIRNTPTTSWRSLGSREPRSRAISPSAGSIESTASA